MLATTVILIASLLILAARIVSLLSLMFFDEPLRRHEPKGSPSLLIAGVLSAVLILAGLVPGPFLASHPLGDVRFAPVFPSSAKKNEATGKMLVASFR